MPLPLHILIHLACGLLAGFIAWRLWGKPLISYGAGFFGSVLIDLDHFVDYFFAFGVSFDLRGFLTGQQFLESDKIYVLFHGWEYSILLSVLAFLVTHKKWLKSGIFSLSLGLFFHLIVDVNVNEGMTVKGYSVLYRVQQNFEIKEIVTSEHYRKHQLQKADAGK